MKLVPFILCGDKEESLFNPIQIVRVFRDETGSTYLQVGSGSSQAILEVEDRFDMACRKIEAGLEPPKE